MDYTVMSMLLMKSIQINQYIEEEKLEFNFDKSLKALIYNNNILKVIKQ